MITERSAAITGMAIILAVGLYLYFSPYQQCVREQASPPVAKAGELLNDDQFLGNPRSRDPAADCLARMGR
jgi:hypothetical protein